MRGDVVTPPKSKICNIAEFRKDMHYALSNCSRDVCCCKISQQRIVCRCEFWQRHTMRRCKISHGYTPTSRIAEDTFVTLQNFAMTRYPLLLSWQQHTMCACDILQRHAVCRCEISPRYTLCRHKNKERHLCCCGISQQDEITNMLGFSCESHNAIQIEQNLQTLGNKEPTWSKYWKHSVLSSSFHG